MLCGRLVQRCWGTSVVEAGRTSTSVLVWRGLPDVFGEAGLVVVVGNGVDGVWVEWDFHYANATNAGMELDAGPDGSGSLAVGAGGVVMSWVVLIAITMAVTRGDWFTGAAVFVTVGMVGDGLRMGRKVVGRDHGVSELMNGVLGAGEAMVGLRRFGREFVAV